MYPMLPRSPFLPFYRSKPISTELTLKDLTLKDLTLKDLTLKDLTLKDLTLKEDLKVRPSLSLISSVNNLLKVLDDGYIGQTATFAHRLQAITTATRFKRMNHSCH